MKNLKLTSMRLLALPCAFVAILSCGSTSPTDGPTPTPVPEPATGEVHLLVTTPSRSYDLTQSSVAFSSKDNMSPTTITLQPATRYQTMDGFGAAITGSTCFNLMQMTAADRTAFLRQTFSPTDGFGWSYVRISIGCSDFSLSEYTCCDTKGIEHFDLTSEENDYVIPILKEILDINPNLKVLGSPWTCPKWMKVNNLTDLQPFDSWTSGQLNPAYYDDYATYFVRWIQAFRSAGVNIYSITPQNEPLNRGNSASLFMTWSEEAAFVKQHLAPALRTAGLTTKIYLFDHNYNYDGLTDQNDYPIHIYQTGNEEPLIAGAAYHNYGGNRDELLDIHAKAPGKELIFTETSIGTWNDGRNLATRLPADMEDVALGTVNNWCKAVIVWNLMLDSDLGPNREGGCQTCYGAVDISNSDYRTISRNSHYYIISHLAAVVRPGATRIGTSGYAATGLSYAAFENTDGTYALVLLNNSTAQKTITVADGTHHFAYTVPAGAVVSYSWNK
ncbi:MAG: glucosylceramidase [Mediterranea sp.]|jgi:glucosylceramidase|nr:glucosylceramidase [Mediterranea sp.]